MMIGRATLEQGRYRQSGRAGTSHTPSKSNYVVHSDASSRLVSSAGRSVTSSPGRAATFFETPRALLRYAAIRAERHLGDCAFSYIVAGSDGGGRAGINFGLTLRHEPGSQALRQSPYGRPCVGPLHVQQHEATHGREVEQSYRSTGNVCRG